MKCPVCDESLREIQKYGVNIDVCPGCKGVWLDRGELEKILDLAATDGPSREVRNDYSNSQRGDDRPDNPSRDHDHREKRDHDDRNYGQGQPHKKRRGSWLGDIFEGFGGD